MIRDWAQYTLEGILVAMKRSFVIEGVRQRSLKVEKVSKPNYKM